MTGHAGCLALFVAAPAFLYAGAAAATLPVLIHLLNRRRYRRVRWAAMEFLLAAERSGRRRVELRDWLLVVLRSLAMLGIGLLVAGLHCDSPAGPRQAMHHLVLLDDSVSMGAARQGGGTVWQQAIEQIVRLAKHLAANSPGSSLRIVRASRTDEPVFDVERLTANEAARLATLLGAELPSYRAGVLAGAVNQAQPGEGALHVVSDLQAGDWKAIDSAMIERLGPAMVEVIDAGPADQANMAAGQLSFERPRPVTHVPLRLQCGVHNFGPAPRSPGSLRLAVGPAAQPAAEGSSVPVGQTAAVPLTLSFETSGPQPVAVEIGADSLPADNTVHQVIPVAEALRVALVAEGADALLLATALRPEGRQSSGIEVTRLSPAELESLAADRFDVVCICNLGRPSTGAAAALEGHAAAGGGVLFFVGDQVDPAAWNQVFYRDLVALLPAPLDQVRDGPAGGSQLSLAEGAKLLPSIAAAPAVLLGGPRVHRWYGLKAPPANRPANTVLKLDGGDPLIAVRNRAGLVTTTADKNWTDLPDHPLYVALCIELAQTLSRPAVWTAPVHVGEALEVDLGAEAAGRRVALHRPSYPRTPPVELTADARGRVVFGDTTEPGVYWLEAQQAGRPVERQGKAVNIDPAESDLRAVPAAELAARLGVSVSGAVAAEAKAPQRPLWRWVLGALAFLLGLEQLLAWRFGRAGRSFAGEPPA